MRIWAISDSHGFHEQYKVPENINVVCHTGDSTNTRDQHRNHAEFMSFLNWYAEIPIQHRIYVAGNHDSFVYHNERYCKEEMKERGIIYLNKEEIVIDGVKFYGDPTSPTFGEWFFMCKRETINRHWELIPDDVNVLLTHTPPKGILDISEDRHGAVELCGCGALSKRIGRLEKLKLHSFGHIHNYKHFKNNGLRVTNNVVFSNSAGVEDRRFDKGLIHNGNVIDFDFKTNPH